jgi:FkbM family methyltransferase
VLDCGAHVGVYSKEALAAGARLVVAIEPAPENLLCLRRNLASEIARGRVIVCPKGVWDKEDILTLNVRESLDDSFVLGGSQTAAKVPVTTIDTLVARLGLERVDFIKMDIEGSEQRALMGAQKTIAKYRPRMALAVYHLPDDRERIPALVRAAWPGSQVACGPCSERNRRIVPDIMYFH